MFILQGDYTIPSVTKERIFSKMHFLFGCANTFLCSCTSKTRFSKKSANALSAPLLLLALHLPFVTAILTNRNGVVFEFCLCSTLSRTNQQPKTTSANNQCSTANPPKATISSVLCFGRDLLNRNLHIFRRTLWAYHIFPLLSTFFLYYITTQYILQYICNAYKKYFFI